MTLAAFSALKAMTFDGIDFINSHVCNRSLKHILPQPHTHLQDCLVSQYNMPQNLDSSYVW